jgi:predicted signal transduction protein with EAL and GGDEF domain/CheY-like chemotaxis protein
MSSLIGPEDKEVATPLRILMLEDVPEEAEVIQRELRKSGLEFTAQRVQTQSAFVEALESFAPQLILADSKLPTFDGRSALRIARQRLPQVPVIMVTGALGDEAAVELLIAGAADYVLKDRLARLAPAVRRALDDAAMKRARRLADDKIRRLTRVLQMLSGINTAVLRIREPAELLEEACRLAYRVGNYCFAFVAMTDANTRSARPAAWAGTGEERRDETTFAVAETASGDSSITGRVLRTGQTIVCEDLSSYAGAVAAEEVVTRSRRHSIASLPLLIDGTPVGAFTVASNDPDAISTEELDLLDEMVANLSFALQYLHKESTVRYLSYFNPLTGLARRRLFCERLTRMLANPPDQALEPTVVALKLGSLHIVNDSFGRHTGDLVLQCVAERLKQRFGDSEHVAHLGGGVFAVLILQPERSTAQRRESREAPARDAGQPERSGGNPEKRQGRDAGQPDAPALSAQEQIFRVLEQPVMIGDRDLPVPIKCGLARYPRDGADAETLVQNAEAALHVARELGTSYVYYRPDMSAGVAEKLALEQRLRGALQRNEFVLYYQPQIDNTSGRLVGAEALLRWRDPERGIVGPSTFMPLLESSGLIVSVGEWVVRRVVEDCRRWREMGLPPLTVAVNVSTIELSHRDFADRFLEIAGLRNGSHPDLHVEITEGVLLEDTDFVTDTLQRLRAHGVRVAIDDFGTGHSSLSRLSQLPIDILKVDRAFTSRLTRDRTSQAVVSTIMALARTYRLGTIAEGVETSEQSEILTTLGCEQSQGYLYSAPIPVEELTAIMKH